MSKEYTRIFTIAGHPALAPGIICLDDMSGLLKWDPIFESGDAIYELDPSKAYSGNQSLRLKTRVEGAAVGDKIGVQRRLHYPVSRKVTYTWVFRQTNLGSAEFITFECSFFDGTKQHYADIRYFPGVPNWSYRNSGGTYTPLPDTAITLFTGSWNLLSMTIDFSTDEYVNATLNNHILLSSRVALHVNGSTSAEYLFARIYLETAGAEATDTSLDSFTAIEV